MSSKPRRPSRDDDQGRFASGTPIGVRLDGKARHPICIPPEMRLMHVHITGSAATGKTTLMGAMILDDIRHGAGLAVIDPCGDLVEHVLHHLTERDIERTVHLRPGEPDFVPIWNPLNCGLRVPIARIADALANSLSVINTSFSDRTQHLLRHGLYAILRLPRGHLSDLANLLRSWSPESRQLRVRLDQVLENDSARCFWREDFARYRRAELLSPLLTVSTLLASGTVGLMLSQGESSFDLRDVMDSGKILLVDLSRVSPEIRSTLGHLLLCLLHLTASERYGEAVHSYQPFHVYVHEAGFLAGAMEGLIAEGRRLNVSLTLSHQSHQCGGHEAATLEAVGSNIIFRVANPELQRFQRTLLGKVSAEDLISLEVGQAFARIGGHVVRIHTHGPPAIPENHHREVIVARCRQRYCKPIEDVVREIRHNNHR